MVSSVQQRVQAPASVVTFLGLVASLVIATGNFSPDKAVAITSVAGAVGTVIVLFFQRPFSITGFTGAAGTIAADLAILGIHTNPDLRAAITALAAFGIGGLLHLVGVPVAMAKAPPPAHRKLSPPLAVVKK